MRGGAGSLRESVKLESRVVTKDSFGESIVSWVDRGTVFAAVTPVRAREVVGSGRALDEQVVTMRLRRNDAIDGSWRATWAGKIYDIQGAQRLDRDATELTCVAGLRQAG